MYAARNGFSKKMTMHNTNLMTYEMTIKITSSLPMQMQNKNKSKTPYLYLNT